MKNASEDSLLHFNNSPSILNMPHIVGKQLDLVETGDHIMWASEYGTLYSLCSKTCCHRVITSERSMGTTHLHAGRGAWFHCSIQPIRYSSHTCCHDPQKGKDPRLLKPGGQGCVRWIDRSDDLTVVSSLKPRQSELSRFLSTTGTGLFDRPSGGPSPGDVWSCDADSCIH